MIESRPENILTRYGIIVILSVQVFIFSLRLTDSFIDGRFHQNWGPPFWLMKAERMHTVNFTDAYFGIVSVTTSTPKGRVVEAWYTSHPQFIAIPLYAWSGIFGFHEWTVRSLAALATVITTVMLWLAMRQRHTPQHALLFALIWILLPTIMIYGSKLDQEPFVFLFLSVAFYAHERFQKGIGKIPWLFAVATSFMMWSDWSGFVFAGCFSVLFFLARAHARTRPLLWNTIIGGVCGAAIVGIQTAFTRNLDSEQSSFAGLVNVYKYRSGSSQPRFWYAWLARQYNFFRLNYGNLGAPVGLASFIWWATRPAQRKLGLQEGTHLWHLFLAVAAGTLLYALAVPQATSIHIYYQIFYSFLIAYGIMRGYELLARVYHKKYPAHAATIVPYIVAVFLAVLMYSGIRYLYQDTTDGWGTEQEITLLKKLRAVPQSKIVVAIVDPKSSVWLANANVEWYTGRVTQNVTPEQGLTADWAIITSDNLESKVKALNEFTPTSTMFLVRGCSPGFCLIERVHKKK